MHKDVVLPCVDFPSFKWLDAKEIDYDYKVVNKVEFKRVLVKLPSLQEENSTEELEAYVKSFIK